MLEDFGGDVQCVEVSAKEGTGLPALTDAVLLLSDMLDLKANPDVAAETVVFGTCRLSLLLSSSSHIHSLS